MSAPARPTFVKRNENLAELAQQPEVGRQREHRAGAGGDAVDRRDDRERAVAHRLHDGAAHARELEQLAGGHPLQLADDLLDVAAGAEAAALAGEDEHARVAAVRQLGEQVAQVGVDVEGQRVELVRPGEGDGRDAVVDARSRSAPSRR